MNLIFIISIRCKQFSCFPAVLVALVIDQSLIIIWYMIFSCLPPIGLDSLKPVLSK